MVVDGPAGELAVGPQAKEGSVNGHADCHVGEFEEVREKTGMYRT